MLYIAILMAAFGFAGCQSRDEAPPEGGSAATETQERDEFVGIVVETMDASGYTYVLADTGEEIVWAAGPSTPMEVGDIVVVGKSMFMPDFYSESLDRTFEEIYFVTHFGDETAARAHGDLMAGGMDKNPHMGVQTLGSGDEVDLDGIAPADHTVAELYENRDSLAFTAVRVRGRVVKSLAGIMGRNWLHVQDGTGSEGTADLTVTTDDIASVGATVVVEGILVLDRDFGSGYRYDVMIENARVTVE